MVKRYKGGLMSSTEATTSISSATGLWNLVQADQARYTGNWPALLTTETPGSGSGAGFANGFMTVSNVSVTDSSYNILNDTPYISTAGGYIKVTGRGFVSGCTVYVGGVPATTTTFISASEVRARIPAASSNTLMVYVVNPDGSTGIKLNSLIFSGTPSWNTNATLGSQLSDVAFSIQFSATSDSPITTYTLDAGSSLPPGTTLYANGLFTGTVTGITSDTNYSFSINASDTENQDTSRTFTVTISSGDQYFNISPLLLNGEANVWIRDSSVNNILPTIGGDTKPSAFSPYNYNWSGFFNGSTDYLSVSNPVAFGTGPYTVEFWFYGDASAGVYQPIFQAGNFVFYFNAGVLTFWNGATPVYNTGSVIVLKNAWNFVQVIRTNTGTNGASLSINGVSTLGTESTNWASSSFTIAFDSSPRYLTGYLADFRISNIARTVGIPSSRLTSDANTLFLTCQNNRFIDNGPSTATITKNGSPSTKSFGPFTETDVITGSAYFDGTGDYLTIADNAALELGASNFCVELWVYPTTVSATGTIIDKRSGTYGPLLFWRFGATLQLYMSSTNTSWDLANGATIGTVTANTWYHVAIYRVGSTIYSSFNGVVSTVTASGSATPYNNAGNWYFGTGTNGSTDPYTGYISDMRFVIGSSVYTSSNFTPTTSSLTSVANTQLLTLQYRTGDNNHRFIDEAGQKALVARAGNASQGSFSPFSPAGWSGYFDGTGDYLSVPNINFGTNAFTIEGWFYATTLDANRNFWGMDNGSGANPKMAMYVNSSSQLTIDMGTAGTTQYPIAASLSTYGIVVNQWLHIALVRTDLTATGLKLYVNGALAGTGQLGTNISNITAVFNVGYMGEANGSPFIGYISNFRIVNGLAVYTGNFTPPTSILGNTQTSGSNISAITSGSTFLSLQDNRFKDNGTNALTITKAGDVKTQAFSPFRPSGIYNPATHGGSVYVDGAGDYLTYTSPPNLTFGTGDFSIEFWVYGLAAAAAWWCFDCRPGADGAYVLVYWDGTSFVYYVNTAARITSTAINIVGQWTHVVVSRVSGSTRMWVNGTVQSTVYSDTTNFLSPGASRPQIGINGLNGLSPSTGYLSGLKVITGSGVTSVTVPTAAPTSTANTAILNNFTNAGIYDATARQHFETVGDAKISNVASKFGQGAMYFDGTGDYLIQPNNPLYQMGNGNYTIEFWIYITALPGAYTRVLSVARTSVSVTADEGTSFEINNTNFMTFAFTDGTTTYSVNDTGVMSTNTWIHYAGVRNGTTLTLYRNGASVGTPATVGTAIMSFSTTHQLYIGVWNGARFFNGYLDDLRITRYARYTANFTAPISTFLLK